MKKFRIIAVLIAMIAGMTGFAVADPGVNQTPETIGVATVTVGQVTGSMISRNSVTMEQSNADPITEVPPLWSDGAYYVSTYNEDTVSNGIGIIQYTKVMDLDTADVLANQYNIEAVKQLTFVSDGTSSIVTTDNIFLDGTGWGYPFATDRMICVFADSLSPSGFPAFCNAAEAGSSIDMLSGSVTTATSNRFIMKSGDPGVELNHDVRVIETVGKASAFMEVLSLEERSFDFYSGEVGPYSQLGFTETTTVDGLIQVFDKSMTYRSRLTGNGGAPVAVT